MKKFITILSCIVITNTLLARHIDAGGTEEDCVAVASLEVFLWEDGDGNGQYNATNDECGESGIDAGVTIVLNQNGVPANDMDGNPIVVMNVGGGNYRIENLAPGQNYQLIVTLSGGYQATTPHYDGSITDNTETAASDDSDFDATGTSPIFELQSGEVKVNIDGGFYRLMTAGGLVWIQGNSLEGSFDGPPNESPVSNIVVNLYADPDNDGVYEVLIGTTTTDINGQYMFMNVPPGDYRIEVDRVNFEELAVLEVYEPISIMNDPNSDDTNFNNNEGSFNAAGGVDILFARMRSGCEPGSNGTENVSFDSGFFFEFDCSTSGSDYLADNCDDTDPNNPDHNPFFPICDLNIMDAFCATMSDQITGNGPAQLCPNGGQPYNISWFSFVAGYGDYTIEVSTGNCQNIGGGIGIQNGIWTGCDFMTEVYCQGNCSTAPIQISSQDPPGSGNYQLIPGEVYHWFLNGCNGSICEFEINVLGDFLPFTPDPPTDLICSSPNTDADCSLAVCPEEEINFALEGIDSENIAYNWSVSSGTNGNEWTVINPVDPVFPLTTKSNNINIRFDVDGIYNVCWENLEAKCYDHSGPLCKEITVRTVADEDFGVVEICEFDVFSYSGPTEDQNGNPDPNGDGLLGWQNTNYIFSGGFHELEVQKADGCVYNESIEVVVKLNPDKAIIDTVFWGVVDSIELFGLVLSPVNQVIEDLNLAPIKASNGCDSIVDLYIWFLNINGEITTDNITNPDGSTALAMTFNETEINDAGFLTVYEYNWYNTDIGIGEGFELSDGDPDNNPRTMIVQESGNYQLDIYMTVNSQQTGLPVMGVTYSFNVMVSNTERSWIGDLVTPTLLNRSMAGYSRLRFSDDEVIKDSELWIYGLWGQEVYHTIDYTNDWAGEGLPSGAYIYVLRVGDEQISRKLMVY